LHKSNATAGNHTPFHCLQKFFLAALASKWLSSVLPELNALANLVKFGFELRDVFIHKSLHSDSSSLDI
jgi:hypothetical protein